MRRAAREGMKVLPDSRMEEWLDKLKGALAATVLVLALAFAVGYLEDALTPPVVGPGPRGVRETCAPVLAWIEEYREENGTWPQKPTFAMKAKLESLPYSCRYSFVPVYKVIPGAPRVAVLSIGSFGQWPAPIYEYYWTSDRGWIWGTDGDMDEADILSLLEEHGYED